MEAATFVDLFSNVGFPTAMCAVLFWILWQDRKEHRKERDDAKQDNTTLLANIQSANNELIRKLEQSIDRNTEVIEKLENMVYKLAVHVDDIRDDIAHPKS